MASKPFLRPRWRRPVGRGGTHAANGKGTLRPRQSSWGPTCTHLLGVTPSWQPQAQAGCLYATNSYYCMPVPLPIRYIYTCSSSIQYEYPVQCTTVKKGRGKGEKKSDKGCVSACAQIFTDLSPAPPRGDSTGSMAVRAHLSVTDTTKRLTHVGDKRA